MSLRSAARLANAQHKLIAFASVASLDGSGWRSGESRGSARPDCRFESIRSVTASSEEETSHDRSVDEDREDTVPNQAEDIRQSKRLSP